MKKIISGVIAVLMIISLLPLYTFAADGVTLAVGTGSATVGSTDIIEIPINLANNEGIASIGFMVLYDKDSLEFAGSSVKGDVFVLAETSVNGDEAGQVMVSTYAAMNKTTNGELVCLKFKLKDGVSVGKKDIKIDITSDTILYGAYNEIGSSVNVTVTNGSITVTEKPKENFTEAPVMMFNGIAQTNEAQIKDASGNNYVYGGHSQGVTLGWGWYVADIPVGATVDVKVMHGDKADAANTKIFTPTSATEKVNPYGHISLAGNYTFTITISKDGYNSIVLENTMTVDQKEVTVNVPSVDKQYDGTATLDAASVQNATKNATLDGVIDKDKNEVKATFPTASTVTLSGSDYGTATYQFSGVGLSSGGGKTYTNYKIQEQPTLTVNITKRPITVTAGSATKKVGTADPEIPAPTITSDLKLATGHTVTYEQSIVKAADAGVGTYPVKATATIKDAGSKDVTANYNITYVDGVFEITDATLTSIEVTTSPDKTNYIEDQTLDTTGLVVVAHYDNDTNPVITDQVAFDVAAGYTFTEADATAEYKTIKVSYGGKDAYFTVNVAKKELTDITLNTTNAKTSFKIGEAFTAEGLIVKPVYNNGVDYPALAAEDYEVSTPDVSAVNDNITVTVTYEGKTRNYIIKVVDKIVTSITAEWAEGKGTYIEGNTIAKEDIVVKANYDNGETNKVVTDFTFTPNTALKTTDNTVTVSYTYGETKTDTLDLTVNAKAVDHFDIESIANNYIEDQKFDKTSVKLKVYYDNGTDEEIQITTENSDLLTVSPEVMTMGTTSVTLTYGGKSVDYTAINVAAKKLVKLYVRNDTKTQYVDGQELDTSKIFITAEYDNFPGTHVLTDKYTVSPTGVLKLEDAIDKKIGITVTSTEDATKTAEFDVEILPCVATVGDEKYASVEDAIKEAEKGDTVKIQSDAVIENALTIVEEIGIEIPENTKLTIKNIFKIMTGGSVNIRVNSGATLEQQGDGSIKNDGELNIEANGAKIENVTIDTKGATKIDVKDTEIKGTTQNVQTGGTSSTTASGESKIENTKTNVAEDAEASLTAKDNTTVTGSKNNVAAGGKNTTDNQTNNEIKSEDTVAGEKVESTTKPNESTTVAPEKPKEDDSRYDAFYWQMWQWRNRTIPVLYTQTTGGTVSGLTTTIFGKPVHITITPDEGYRIVDVLVDGKSVGAVETYTIRSIKTTTTVSAIFEKIEEKIEVIPEEPAWINPFTDVGEMDAFYTAVQYVYENGLFKGVSDTEFAPATTMTRAMFVTVLGRLTGIDPADYTAVPFTDYEAGTWFAAYVDWAANAGIVKGISETEFAPDMEVTIEQAITILYRYMLYMGYDVSATVDLAAYADGADVSDWAIASVQWAIAEGIYAPVDGQITANAAAARSTVAEMIWKLSLELVD